MLRATGIAHLAARRVFPETYSREQIDVGMGALAGLIVFWSEYIEQIEARPDDQRSDVYDFARKFENDCHNLCLDEQIDERASARRAAAPRTFLAAAREAIAA